MKDQREKSSLIQFHVFSCNENGLGLLKLFLETSFYERKKEIIIKTWTLHERKVHIKKKGKYEFSDKGKVDIMDFWE